MGWRERIAPTAKIRRATILLLIVRKFAKLLLAGCKFVTHERRIEIPKSSKGIRLTRALELRSLFERNRCQNS